eukprot:COSAG01_NODE_28729_length_654_cov_0.881081_1_plen_109_part_10
MHCRCIRLRQQLPLPLRSLGPFSGTSNCGHGSWVRCLGTLGPSGARKCSSAEQPEQQPAGSKPDEPAATAADATSSDSSGAPMDRTLMKHVAILTGSQLMLNLGFSQVV